MTTLATIEMSLHGVAEFHNAIGECKQGVILTEAHILAREDACAALAYDDHTCLCCFTIADFYTQKFRIGVLQVFCCSACFSCCHNSVYFVRMNIHEFVSNINTRGLGVKRLANELAVPFLIVLVGVGSFGLGRLSALEAHKQPILVSQNAAAAMTKSGSVIASKTGTKYHFPWCAGASKISEGNKIMFPDEKSARQAG